MKVGDRVQYSWHALEPKRAYMQLQGEVSRRARAQHWYDDAKALRGTVTAVEATGVNRESVITVAWDNGTRSISHASQIEASKA